MIWFSSDWHIGHDKEFCYKKRGFSSPEEMDTAILLRTNEVVALDDELWILGDLAMSSRYDEWNRVFYNLNCQNIHFIQGNHDTDPKMDIYEEKYGFIFHGYADMLKYTKTKRFYLSHYPTIVSNYGEEKRFFWNLSGHTHSNLKFYNSMPMAKIYNVAVDAHNCYPVSIEQIIKDIEGRERKGKEFTF